MGQAMARVTARIAAMAAVMRLKIDATAQKIAINSSFLEITQGSAFT